jgi:hypothetical protein
MDPIHPKHALKMGSLLVPVIKLYQIVLCPLAKPTGFLLDKWLGKDGIKYWREHQLRVNAEHGDT